MNSLVRSIPLRITASQNGDGTVRGVIAEDPIVASGRILAAAECKEERGADHHPRRVEQPKVSPHGIIIAAPMTRAEIESKLLDIVKSEKNIPDDKLAPETALADAGIDSLDALSILFAIEEQFHISIPDDKARSIKTFADMISVVEELLPA